MGKELPIGFTKETVGIPRVGVNCAGCHTGNEFCMWIEVSDHGSKGIADIRPHFGERECFTIVAIYR